MPSIPPNEHILTAQDISFSYGETPVLENISLTISRGDYLGIIGPNGAGKTTLLKIILGLLAPTSGSICLFEKDLHAFREWQKIGYVPQKTMRVEENFPATVYDVVLMGTYSRRGLLKRTNANDHRDAEEALGRVGMTAFKDRLIGNLSGGQQQRVFIARALAGHPEIIFLDEPAVGVDPKIRQDFYTLLRKMNAELNLTLVLISHDIETVLREAKHVACINKTLVRYGTPEEIMQSDALLKTFSGELEIIVHQHHASS
jgi:zinc transport system ATP-binding protein